jgi:hypothetical protein
MVIMEASEIQAKIKKAVSTLKGFEAMGGQMVTDAINVFNQAHEIVADYPDCDLSPVSTKIKTMNAQFGPYKSMAPDVGDALDTLMSIIE